MTTGEIHGGGCLCGAIRYSLKGQPSHATVCYCTQCQKQTGSLVPAMVTYELENVELLAGTPAVFRSSTIATRQFCDRCGSTLFWRGDGRTEVDIFMGTLDDPSTMPAPSLELWTTHRAKWLAHLDGTESHETSQTPDETDQRAALAARDISR